MAGDGSQLMTLCAVGCFVWLSYALERHTLAEKPYISSIFILLGSGLTSIFASFFSRWFPGANGRFDDELYQPGLAHSASLTPRRPRRYFVPSLICLIVVRVEVFHRINLDYQCSTPGVECFLPLVFYVYELWSGTKSRLNYEKIEDDISQTAFEEAAEWLQETAYRMAKTNMPQLISIAALCYATFSISNQDTRSTFVCSSSDSRLLVAALEWFSVLMDAAIAVMLWRVLTWARTTKLRLRTLGGILTSSSVLLGILNFLTRFYVTPQVMLYHFKGLGSLYVFDLFIDGTVFSALLISASLAICEDAPLQLSSVLTLCCGLLAASHRVLILGSWENAAPVMTVIPVYVLCISFPVFTYSYGVRSVLFVPRILVLVLLFALIITATIFALLRRQVFDGHPLQRLIYDTRIAADRWLVHATVSDSLRIAVQEYQERYGRSPPPNFDEWYKFALEKNSPIIDHFAQIDTDISPFWGMAPERLRQTVDAVLQEPMMACLTISGGAVTHSLPPDSPDIYAMDDLVQMITAFSARLPDMQLPINTDERPRVLTPWEDVYRFKDAAKRKGLTKLLTRRGSPEPIMVSTSEDVDAKTGPQVHRVFTSVTAMRQMTALTCPRATRGRSGLHWDVRDFCSSCAAPQSTEQFLKDWALSQSLCHQSDLTQLHGFKMTPSWVRPIQDLVPVFSRTKTDRYSDILIPLNQVNTSQGVVRGEPTDRIFMSRKDNLFWRGKTGGWPLSQKIMRGGHQERLSYLINNASRNDEVTVFMPLASNKAKFQYRKVSLAELNGILPFDVGFSDFGSSCKGPHCKIGPAEFGMKPDDNPLNYRYPFLLDSDDGPPSRVLEALKSASVPFIGSIFKEWYTERLMPWIHFVPIDLRFHALHSTLAYFTGVSGNGPMDGKGPEMDGKLDDAIWIADQGKRWAEKALRREDMEVYLFRLLLEWGRLIDDKRDDIGFVLS